MLLRPEVEMALAMWRVISLSIGSGCVLAASAVLQRPVCGESELLLQLRLPRRSEAKSDSRKMTCGRENHKCICNDVIRVRDDKIVIVVCTMVMDLKLLHHLIRHMQCRPAALPCRVISVKLQRAFQIPLSGWNLLGSFVESRKW